MVVDDRLLGQARESGGRLLAAQHGVELAKADYYHAIRRLHFAGASLREIADALGLSHQRVHQIIEASGGTIGWKPRKKASTERVCAFCGRPEPDVSKLIAGPGAHICDDCVGLAEEVGRRGEATETARTRLDPVSPGSELACSFCGKVAGDVGSLVAGPGVRICDVCLGLCDEILAAQS